MGNNSSGFKNEQNMINSINGKKYDELNPNLKRLIKYIHGSCVKNIDLQCTKADDSNGKPDIVITIEKKRYAISVKEGKSNSVHQESVESFVEYATNDLDMTKEDGDSLKKFVFGDGTIDGTGLRSERKTAKQIAAEMKSEMIHLQAFLDKHKETLLYRFLIKGNTGSDEIDYLYYGTPERGVACSTDEIITIHSNQREKLKTELRLGNLSLQAQSRALAQTNRNEKGWKKAEKKRGDIQLKWTTLESDINFLRLLGTDISVIGDLYEYVFVRQLNQKKKSNEWKYLCEKLNLKDAENVYAVRVMGQKFSNAAKRKVKSKADVYLIHAINLGDYLHEVNFELNEKNIGNVEYSIIPNSGISVKMKASKSYTFSKISPTSFDTICKNIPKCIGVGCTLFSEEINKIDDNKKAFEAWNTTFEEWVLEIQQYIDLGVLNIKSSQKEKLEAYKKGASFCRKMLKEKIQNDDSIKEKIFSGKQLFSDPYCANFMYTMGELTQITYDVDFTVTSASGRTKRNRFDIVIKPR